MTDNISNHPVIPADTLWGTRAGIQCFAFDTAGSPPPRGRLIFSGFTLIEMLVVLVIIGLLAGLIGPRLFTKVDSAKVQTAQTQVKMLKGTLETLRLDIGRFPTESEGLAMLNTPPADEKLKSRWRGPYLDEELPKDPWGNPYQYSIPGSNSQPFALYSLGADGKRGGEGLDADVGYLPGEAAKQP